MILTYLTNSDHAVKAMNNAYIYAMKRSNNTRFVTCVEEQKPSGDWHETQLFGIIMDILNPGDELVIYDLSSLGFNDEDVSEMMLQVALKGLILHVLKYNMKVLLKDQEDLGFVYGLVEAAH
jgi:DNA invertase Pin-like site-specific DNA recombinase